MISKNSAWFWVTILLSISSPKVAGNEPDYDTPPAKVAEYREKALKGDPIAQYNLAWLTTLGWAGVTEDKVKARELFLKSAEQGYSEAQITLADLSISGELNGKYDLPNALSWYIKAAEQGSNSAYFKLGCLSLEGNDMFEFFMQLEKPRYSLVKITQDKRLAGEYWRKAGLAKSKVDELLSLHERSLKGDWEANREMSEILSDKSLSALKGDMLATFHLMKYKYHLFDSNLEKAKNGDVSAMILTANSYESPACPGHPEKNSGEQLQWLLKAAQSDSIDALYELGKFFSQNEESENLRKSLNYYKQAADKGHARAMCSLASIYEAKEDLHESTRWMIKAAEAGDSASWFYVGHRYQNGKGVPVNFVKAYAWFSISSSEEKERPDSVTRRRLKELSALMTAEQIAEGQKLAEQIWQNLERKLSSNHTHTAAEKLDAQVRLDLERAKLRSNPSK
jgi:TPR repeat protein